MNRFVLPDASLLIALYNQGAFLQEYSEVIRTRVIRYSAVVLNEFLRGAHDPRSRKIGRELVRLASGRVVTPTEQQWLRCAQISQSILKTRRRTREEILCLQNDLLIALSVRDVGGSLLTLNEGDFALIQRYLPFHYVTWKQ